MATKSDDDDRLEATTRPKERKSRGLQAGEILAGRFELVSKLGQGGIGEVWKAVHRRLGINVAVKIPLVRDSETLERFRREAQALCLIDSEYVLRCFEYGETPIPFLVMELLKGESLADRLEREGPMPLSTVKAICAQLCKGLQATHRVGVIHRDLKPGNIYCIEDRFKIVDFGLMKLVESTQDPATKVLVTDNDELTRANTWMGTLVYMSPEQVRQANRVDFRSDLWSLGVVLYRLLTAQQPFAGKAQYQIVQNIIEQQPPSIAKFVPGLSPEVDAFFRVALDKDPARRFGSAVQLGEAFAAIPDVMPQPLPSRPKEPEVEVSTVPIVVRPLPPAPLSLSSKKTLEEMSTAPVADRPDTRPSPSVEEAVGEPPTASPVVDRPAQPSPEDPDDVSTRPIINQLPAESPSPSPSPSPLPSTTEAAPRPRLGPKVLALAAMAAIAAGGLALFAQSQTGCDASRRDCDGALLNGCETSITTTNDCGACGLHCGNSHGSTSCIDGKCVPRCSDGYANCDGSPTNGCEAWLASPEHCGACDISCANAHGKTTCSEGRCLPTCAPGYEDCDQNLSNGCEAEIVADANNCGRCGRSCGTPLGQGATCFDGICKMACGPGTHDCNGDPSDGCEVNAAAKPDALVGGRCAPITLATHERGAFGIDVDPRPDGDVRWTIPARGQIRSVAKRGGSEKNFNVGGTPTKLVFETGRWYWTDTSASRIAAFGEKDMTAQEVMTVPGGPISALGVSDGEAFVSADYSLDKMLHIVTTIEEYEPLSSNLYVTAGKAPGPLGLAASTDAVYMALPGPPGAIRAIRYKGAQESWSIAEGQENPTAIILDPRGKSVIWTNAGDGSGTSGAIMIAHTDGLGKRVLSANEHEPRVVAADDFWVYWTNADGAVKKKRLDGSGDSVLLASSEKDPVGIAVDETRVYWVNRESGEVRMAVK